MLGTQKNGAGVKPSPSFLGSSETALTGAPPWRRFLVIRLECFLAGFIRVRVVVRFVHRIFRFAPSILDLPFGLLCGALRLGPRISRPFAGLPFSAARDVFSLSLNAIFVHENLRNSLAPPGKVHPGLGPTACDVKPADFGLGSHGSKP